MDLTVKSPEILHQDYFELRNQILTTNRELADLLKPLRGKNPVSIEAKCAEIKLLSQGLFQFRTMLNGLRVAEENAAGNFEELQEIRRKWAVLTGQVGLLTVELNQWHAIETLARSQARAKRTKLYPGGTQVFGNLRSQLFASDDIFSRLKDILNPAPQSDEARDHDCFADIGLPNSEFVAHMHAAYRVMLSQRVQSPWKFLDVGCGGGLKVLTASRYFDVTDGLEYDPGYVRSAQDLLGRDNEHEGSVIHADALTFDRYDEYDVIYFYRPMGDDDKLREMEEFIVGAAAPGTLLVAPYMGFGERHGDLGCGRIDGVVYAAGTSQSKADRMRRDAELTGPYIIKKDEPKSATIWDAVLTASRSNGHDLEHRYLPPRH